MASDMVKTEVVRGGAAERFREPDAEAPEVGRWFWVTPEPREGVEEDEREPWLGCVTEMGSNYAQLSDPTGGSERIHLDAFEARCRFEADAEGHIQRMVATYQARVRELMGEARDLTARLSVGEAPALEAGSQHALVLHDNGAALEGYKAALVQAKDKALPDIFKEIREVNEAMGEWMQAGLLPLKAQARRMEGSIKAIEARIFHVELYAGLTEEVEMVKDGAPATREEPLHLMQRRCYMDEEALARYEAGGMEFKDIGAFDAWLARKENFHRLLPHPRCAVAFQVRRNEKEREFADFRERVRFALGGFADLDKLTFLYLRNGERLYRLSTTIDFGEQLFPDFTSAQLSGVLYARISGRSVEDLITEGAWLEMKREEESLVQRREAAYQRELAAYPAKLEEYERARAAYEAALAAGAEKKSWMNPDGVKEPEEPSRPWEPYVHRRSHEYEPFVPSSVYYDDIAKHLQEQRDRHNRLVLVLQGLLDRSPVLHPHPGWKLFTQEGFAAGLRLVYDDSRALTPGEAPDFEAYRAQLNAQLRPGDVTVGQEEAWLLAEGKKETERRGRIWNWPKYDREVKRYRPDGNPGPGVVARVAKRSRDGSTCAFSWKRERLRQRHRPSLAKADEFLPCHLEVETRQLLNVSAYKPGDFRRFYDDPRTRADYLKWAPLLLRAEDFHAGKLKLREDGEEGRGHGKA